MMMKGKMANDIETSQRGKIPFPPLSKQTSRITVAMKVAEAVLAEVDSAVAVAVIEAAAEDVRRFSYLS
jgi:hypothetical protein